MTQRTNPPRPDTGRRNLSTRPPSSARDGGGHLWLRVDGQRTNQSLAFDNMDGRAPTGTTDWQDYSIVLDVPADATRVNYGFFVQGKGRMWVNGVTITPVTADVPSTDPRKKHQALPTTPVNLRLRLAQILGCRFGSGRCLRWGWLSEPAWGAFWLEGGAPSPPPAAPRRARPSNCSRERERVEEPSTRSRSRLQVLFEIALGRLRGDRLGEYQIW